MWIYNISCRRWDQVPRPRVFEDEDVQTFLEELEDVAELTGVRTDRVNGWPSERFLRAGREEARRTWGTPPQTTP
ncbi:unnamed protein product [Echinostoma caproni]|uniref:Transposase n=1 Tax=Echinostoma caproni TaxID=27848 RepID=A0A183A6G6_9TREM|nr:unnamed protein product [Echinostoma caproni]